MATLFIFDFDGVLVDIQMRYYWVYADLLLEHHIQPPDFEAFISLRKRLPAGRILEQCIPATHSNRDAIIRDCRLKRDERYESKEYLVYDVYFPGALALLKDLREAGITLGLVTRRENPDTFFAQVEDIRKEFAFVSVAKNKRETIARMLHELQPDKTYFLTDTKNDIDEIADLAEVETIAIPTGLDSAEMLLAAKPHHCIESLTEVYALLHIEKSS